MALSEIIAVLKANTTEFTAKMDAAEGKMQAMSKNGSSSMAKLSSAGVMAFEAIGGAAVGIGIYSVIQANKLEDAHAALGRAFKNTGTNMDAQKGKVDAVNSKFEKFGYTNAQTEDALQRLVSATGNVGGSFKAMGTAADIAKARHIDLDTATGLMAKTMAGNVTAAKRMGIAIPASVLAIKDPTEKANAVLGILNDHFGGQAATASKTFGGQMEATKAKVQDLAAKLGEKLIPIIQNLIDKITKVVSWLSKHKEILYAMGIAVALALTVLAVLWVVNTIAAMAFWTAATGGIILLVAALAAGIIWIVTHWHQVWAEIKKIFNAAVSFLRGGFGTLLLILMGPVGAMIFVALHWKEIWNIMKDVALAVWHFLYDNIIRPIVDFFTKKIPEAIQIFKLGWQETWKDVKKVIKSVWDWVYNNVIGPIINYFTVTVPNAIEYFKLVFDESLRRVKEIAKEVWDWIWNNLVSPIVNFCTKTVPDAWDQLVDFFKGIPGKISSAVSGMWDGIKDSFKSALNWVIGKWNDFKIPSIDVLGFHSPEIKTPNIPYLAAGGIVPATPGGRLAMLGEGGSAEAVIPLDGKHSMGGSSNSVNNYVTINVQGGDPQATVNALRTWIQRNGTLANAGVA
jgi:hypothetical protein